MELVVTIVSGRVEHDAEDALVEAYGDETLPAYLLESMLLRDGRDWTIVMVWRSRDDLDRYQASSESAAGVAVFQAAGVEPSVQVFDVTQRATGG